MLCVITHIHKYASDNSDGDSIKQVNNVIKTLFYAWSEDKLHVTLDLFWTDYTEFDRNNGSFNGDKFIWKRKYISDGNSNLCHQKDSLTCTKVLSFVACRFTSKVLGIGSAECSWGDVNITKSDKISAIISDVPDK